MPTTNTILPQAIDMMVLGYLRGGNGTSRVELARRLAVAPSTVGTHVDRLVGTGLLRERKSQVAAKGRPPTIVELNPEAGQFIGVDLDARGIYGASVDFSQRLLRDRTEMIASRETADEVIERIGHVIEDVRDQSRELLGIGLAVPGTVDTATGRAIHYRYIRGWRDLDLVKEISTRFHVPVCIENNVRTMAFAERSFGQARTTDDFVCLCIRSGIGAAMFIDGEVYRGGRGLAGEIGSWPCDHSRSASTLEEIASLRAVFEQLAAAVKAGRKTCLKLMRNRVTMDGLIAAIDAGDRLVLNTLRDAANVVGEAAAKIALLVDPSRIIVCGPLAELDSSFMSPFREAIDRNLPKSDTRSPTINASELGTFAGALGAAALAVQSWNPADAKAP